MKVINPSGPKDSIFYEDRVTHGGGWFSKEKHFERFSDTRDFSEEYHESSDLGFRMACNERKKP